ncbi:MAG TPA: efflux RND transporter periplasmic adaptor subunit, partial [Ramlibacter sp.]
MAPSARLLLPTLVLLLLAACGKQGDGAAAAGGAPGGGMPPPEVGVVTVALGDVGLVTELPGRLEASRVAQVRARTPGIVQQRLFREGSDVKQGQPLFRIDPSTLQAGEASAKAALARSQANLGQARALAERYKPLVEANAISKQDYANAVAAQKAAEADVAASEANVRTAQINLTYANVTAPISGRIGRALVTEGALVGEGEATPLALIQQINPLFVNISQSSVEVLNLRRAVAEGRLKRSGDGANAKVILEDNSEYPQPARVLFSDLQVDPTSGQVTVRAEVPNPQGFLLPGMYVRVRLEQAKASNAILLPQQAVTRSGQG